jgi:tetratricopeptide (TPR) repeat protein
MAQIAHHLGRGDEAEGLLARCVEASPDHQPYRHNYAVLSLTDKLDEAEAQPCRYRKKTRATLVPEFVRTGTVQAKALLPMRLRTSRAGTDHPESPELWARLGSTLRSVGGHTEEAIAAFRRAVQIAPSLGSMWCPREHEDVRFSQADIDAMEAELPARRHPQHRADMHYALGKRTGIWDLRKILQHYTRGNAIRRIDLNMILTTRPTWCRAPGPFTSGF